MKKALFILATFILLKPIIPVIEYVVNYDYIATVLCVNKDKPVMKCDGKCYLMKQLAKTAEEEKPNTDKKVVIKLVEVLFCEPIILTVVSKPIIPFSNTLNVAYSNHYSYLNCSGCFHPPTFIA